MKTLWVRLTLCALFPLSAALSACGAEIQEAEELSLESGVRSTNSPKREALFWDGVVGTMRRLPYVEVDGMAVHGGDILLGPVDEVAARTRTLEAWGGLNSHDPQAMGSVSPWLSQRWPRAVVPYTIASNLPNQARVKEAIAHWEKKTRVNFVLRTTSNASKYPNYVHFRPSNQCNSYIGMIGGRQDINLSASCDKGAVVHEIGHALGFWHEQGRADRDKYVRIYKQNIIPGMADNFDKAQYAEDVGKYDYNSVMHYHSQSFSKNGKPTILKLNGQPIEYNTVLSSGDVAAFNRLYPR